MLKERMLLLELGESLGYPRLGYARPTGRDRRDLRRIPQGKAAWESFCAHAHASRLPAALRIARMLRDNGVAKFHPLSGQEVMPNGTAVRTARPLADMIAGAPASPSPAPVLIDDIEPAPAPAKPLSKEERRARNKAAWAARPRDAAGKRRAPAS